MWEYQHTDELYHYGVKGMKWGVRKNPVKAYAKASRKQQKLDARIDKKQTKLDKWKTRQKESAEKLTIYEPAFKARETAMQVAANRYNAAKAAYNRHGNRFDMLGVKSRSLRRVERSYEAAASAFNRAARPYNKALMQTSTANEKIKKLSKQIKKATAKSEKWQRAMNETFADVPKKTIAAGKELFEERYKR